LIADPGVIIRTGVEKLAVGGKGVFATALAAFILPAPNSPI